MNTSARSRATARRRLVARLALTTLVTGTLPLGGALAQDAYPSKPVRVIVPFAPGGGTDFVARVMAPRFAERLGRPFVVENRGGAGAVIGTQLVASAAPDGYTLLINDSAHAIQPVLQKLDYDPIKSFSLIATIARGDNVLAVPGTLPASNVKEFVALARAKPGTLVAGTAGPGSMGHMAVELFRVLAGIDLVIAHFKGAGAATTDLLGAQIHLASITIPAALPHLKTGRLRVIGIGGTQRSPLLPDVPTIEEQGLAGYNTTGWRGLAGPAGLAPAIVDRLTREVRSILAMPEVRAQFETNGMDPDYRDPKEFAAFIAEEIRRWTLVAQKANIKL
jgi:tripartite-type tricarboxylate transporter receptor subunit TctC